MQWGVCMYILSLQISLRVRLSSTDMACDHDESQTRRTDAPEIVYLSQWL